VGKGLDPQFNFMEVARPFALQLMSDMTGNNGGNLLDEIGRQAAQVGSTALSLPRRIDDTIEKLERGDIRVRVRSSESDRLLRRLGSIQMGTNYTLFISALLISATLLFVGGFPILASGALGIALAPGIALFRLLRRIERQERMF
jgi:predicted unusual protein kinase regulating ubiquinone biosynthesis (AarF/ABC1/UbiB family)